MKAQSKKWDYGNLLSNWGGRCKGALRVGMMGMLLCLGLCLASAQAVMTTTYSFKGVTNNLVGDVAIGEAQFFVDVSSTINVEETLFTFRNTGPEASYMSDVLCFDGVLLSGSFSLIQDTTEVEFSEGSNQSNNFESKFGLVSGLSLVQRVPETFFPPFTAVNGVYLSLFLHAQKNAIG